MKLTIVDINKCNQESNKNTFKLCRCGNVAAILELDENLTQRFIIFESAPQVCSLLFNKKQKK